MRRAYSFALLALTALTPVFLTTASVARAPVAEQAGPQPLSDDELSGLRGGFTTVSGVTFGFGVVIRSYIDNKLALQTQLTWTPTGPVTEQVRGDVPGLTDLASAVTTLINNGINLSAITGGSGASSGGTGGDAATSGTGSAGNTGGTSPVSGTGGASNTGGLGPVVGTGDAGSMAGSGAGAGAGAGAGSGAGGAGAAAGSAVGGTGGAGSASSPSPSPSLSPSVGAGSIGNTGSTVVADGILGGVALVDASGATALIHNVTAGQIQSFIVNNANNRNLRQDIEMNLYLPDLATMQAASSMQQRAAQMTYDLNTSLVGSIR